VIATLTAPTVSKQFLTTRNSNQTTMNTIEAKEVPLIKVLTVKKKHLQGLRESSRITADTNFASLAFLGYITEWDSVLARRMDNEHLVVFQAIAYYMSREKIAKDWRAEQQAAREEIHNLPQLFLD
jgi:hypothetical protein